MKAVARAAITSCRDRRQRNDTDSESDNSKELNAKIEKKQRKRSKQDELREAEKHARSLDRMLAEQKENNARKMQELTQARSIQW